MQEESKNINNLDVENILNPFTNNISTENAEEHTDAAQKSNEAHLSVDIDIELSEDSTSKAVPSSQHRETEDKLKQSYQEFEKEFNEKAHAEDKLRLGLAFMEHSLAHNGTPQFKSFWDARKLCLPLFKDTLQPNVKVELWTKYNELATEARRLKEILDEQSTFAAEQIDSAIKAIEQSLESYKDNITLVPAIDPSLFQKALEKQQSYYIDTQKELNLLNTHATRINSLRKELIKTEMRIKIKNQFFQRLSSAGDSVFPRRKDLIANLSENFQKDVEQFIGSHFNEERVKGLLFQLREEIKSMQSLAKVLTINTQTFNYTRKKLSECWDRLKELEKDLKKQKNEKRGIYKENQKIAQEKIEALKVNISNEAGFSAEAIQKQIQETIDFIYKIDLERPMKKELFAEIEPLRKNIENAIKEEMQAKLSQEEKARRQKQEQHQELRKKIQSTLQEAKGMELETLDNIYNELNKEILEASFLSKADKQTFERLLKPIKDILVEKKASNLIALSADDQQLLDNLRLVLKEQQQRRKEIKTQLESYRKSRGASGLDFEKSLSHQKLIEEEKERLENIDAIIKETEQKINSLKSNS
ncbi:MAG: hypothetical protein K0S74_594 [Chlamydiales bacterium]|jgi:hypothetical protein|nr:hypothetical protein [Chlamydiales bacterium]